MREDRVTSRLVDQRIRNRIIEYLFVVTEFETDPGVLDLNELVNAWEMNVDHPFSRTQFPSPTFTSQEVSALQAVDDAWSQFCESTPQKIKDQEATFALPQWVAFREQARASLKVFALRGELSEEFECE